MHVVYAEQVSNYVWFATRPSFAALRTRLVIVLQWSPGIEQDAPVAPKTIDKVQRFTDYGREQQKMASNAQSQVGLRRSAEGPWTLDTYRTAGSLSFKTIILHKSAEIDLDLTAAFHNRMLAVTAIHKSRGSKAEGTEITEDEKRAMGVQIHGRTNVVGPVTGCSPCWPISVLWP